MESLQYFRAHYPNDLVPLPLQRQLLEEALHYEDLASNASLLGNRVAAIRLDSAELLICSPIGAISETLNLSTLRGSHKEHFQVPMQAFTLVWADRTEQL